MSESSEDGDIDIPIWPCEHANGFSRNRELLADPSMLQLESQVDKFMQQGHGTPGKLYSGGLLSMSANCSGISQQESGNGCSAANGSSLPESRGGQKSVAASQFPVCCEQSAQRQVAVPALQTALLMPTTVDMDQANTKTPVSVSILLQRRSSFVKEKPLSSLRMDVWGSPGQQRCQMGGTNLMAGEGLPRRLHRILQMESDSSEDLDVSGLGGEQTCQYSIEMTNRCHLHLTSYKSCWEYGSIVNARASWQCWSPMGHCFVCQ